MCSAEFGLGSPIFPAFDTSGGEDSFDFLREQCYRGAEERYGELSDPVVKRLEHELAIVRKKGFAPYFLVVRDIVRQSARTCGRGSAAASLISYCLGITHVEPITHNLFFERFLNEGRTDPPDIDIDFPWDERDAVLDYVFEQYGADRTAMISNHVGLSCPGGGAGGRQGLRVARGGNQSVTRRMGYYWSLRGLPERVAGDPVYKDLELKAPWPEIVRLAVKLDGYPRYMSVHCGGVVIVPDRVDRYVPVELAPKGVRVVQWEKDQAEDAGLVKIDLLGNRSLSVIRDAFAAIRENYGVAIDYDAWDPTSDPATQELVRRGDTVGVFYAESPAMRQLQQKCGRGDFNHLVIHSSIIRPAANKYIREYVRRLRGGAYEPLHPIMEEVLDETYGIMVYQEDVSRIAMAMAGFSPVDADLLRKILSKKRTGTKLEDYREKFLRRGAPPGRAPRRRRRGLGHDPQLCRLLVLQATLRLLRLAVLQVGVVASPPSRRVSRGRAQQSGRILFPLRLRLRGAQDGPDRPAPGRQRKPSRVLGTGTSGSESGLMQVKGLREIALETVVAQGRKRPYESLDDFLWRAAIDPSDTRLLIKSGALDSIACGATRPEMIWKTLAWHERRSERRGATGSLFGDAGPVQTPRVPHYSPQDGAAARTGDAGFPHQPPPPRTLPGRLARLSHVPAADLGRHAGRQVTTIGWWVSGKVVTTKDGDPMEFISFEDTTALYETTLFPGNLCALLSHAEPLAPVRPHRA